jgi:tetratricopeptide (TPR) repeat protein
MVFIGNAYSVRFIQDDAFTSLRYAKNLIEGNGLVFNNDDRVEGYTNFSWVLLNVPILIFTQDVETAIQLLSVLFSFLTLIAAFYINKEIFRIALQVSEKQVIIMSALPLVMLSVSPAFIYWGISGMETSLFLFLILLMILIVLKRKDDNSLGNIFVILSVIISLTRPEGLLVTAILFFHKTIFLSIQQRGSIKQRTLFFIKSRLLRELITYLLIIGIYYSAKTIYYGYPLPNTFYAKTSFNSEYLTRGIEYFNNFAKHYLSYGIIFLMPIYLFRYKKIRYEITILYSYIIIWTISIILIGGDVLPINRFFLPVLPLIFLLFVLVIIMLIELMPLLNKLNYWYNIICVTLIIIPVIFYIQTSEKMKMHEVRSYETGLVKKMKIYAKWMNDQPRIDDKKPVIAMSTIGAFSFSANAEIIDLVGLTDKYTAHNPLEEEGIDVHLPVLWKERRYNAKYVMLRRPDYIIFPAGAKPSAFAECAVYIQQEFYENYYTQLFYSDELKQLLPIFTKKESVRQSSNRPCSVDYLKYFIEATNDFLNLTNNPNESALPPLFSKIDSVINFCPDRTNESLTLKGMSYYHLRDYKNARTFLEQAAETDSTNAISRIYLKNIYQKSGENGKAVRMLMEAKRFSPDIIPTFKLN